MSLGSQPAPAIFERGAGGAAMAGSLKITTPAGSFAAYVAAPVQTPASAIVVIQEIFGVNAVMRGICEHFAAHGYLAVCPDLFWRIEPGIDITDHSQAEWKRAFELFNAFDVEAGVQDIAATIEAVRGDGRCNGKVGAVGFCLGGLLAYLTAVRTDADASVGYYGVGIERYLAEADKLVRPLVLHIAEEDQFVPKPAQALIKAALNNHPGVSLYSYPGRDHAFARPGGEHYDASDAALADQRTLAAFASGLG
jgi:carboxymethylenebutenolidase